MPALAELEAAWLAARARPGVPRRARRAAARLRRAPDAAVPRRRLSEAAGPRDLAQARGPQPHRRAQDQQRARPGAARPADGQEARSSPRPAPASTASRPRRPARCSAWSASSTWAPRTSAASRPTSSAWSCSARRVVAGRGRRADAQGGGLRGDPRLGHQRRRHALHHRLGRRAGAVPGDRARPAARDRRRGARAAARARGPAARRASIACVGGGSNAIGMFAAFVDDAGVELIGVEAAGEGLDTGRHGAPLTVGGRPGVLHGSLSAILQDDEGQILEAHSVSAGLDYPGSGPEHAWLRDSGRATLRRGDRRRRAGRVSRRRRGWRGSSRRSRPRTRSHYALREPATRELDLVCLLGPRRQGPRRGARAWRRSDVAGDRAAPKRDRATPSPPLGQAAGGADALPDGRLPRPRRPRSAIGEAYADGGADLVELGVPFSDPLADGPVIHAAGHRGARGGRDGRRRARGRARRSRRACRWW